MLDTPVLQNALVDVENYHEFWTGMVSKIVELCFQNSQHFTSAYGFNPNGVFKTIKNRMKIVPIDLKDMLDEFFNSLIEAENEGPEPPRSGVA
jgi:hypothetical protein